MKKTLSFLTELRSNNNREWFEAKRDLYEASHQEVKNLASTLEEGIRSFDVPDPNGTHVFRIYRDVRFSKDKTPYKVSRSMYFTRMGHERRGGYYVHIEPDNSFIACGFWEPSPDDLRHIRKQISQDPDLFRQVLNDKEFKRYFGELEGEKLKTAPKGFDREDPAIDLIRHKRFIITHAFANNEIEAKDFPEKVTDGFRRALPFLEYMTEILTTDLNGEPIEYHSS